MEINMEAVETKTATEKQKGQTFIKSVAVHLVHANRHVNPYVCDFRTKNKGIFKNIIIPAMLLLGVWYLIPFAMLML